MKMQTLVRMQMLVGLGAALTFAGSVRAQQVVDPSASNRDGAAQTSEVTTAQVPVIESDGSENIMSMALGRGAATREETEMARVMIADVILLAIFMGGIGSIALYAMAATRRNRTLEPVLRDRLQQVSYRPASVAATLSR
jgi:hypothetical protein